MSISSTLRTLMSMLERLYKAKRKPNLTWRAKKKRRRRKLPRKRRKRRRARKILKQLKQKPHLLKLHKLLQVHL